jgi:RHS repeat-associated protein/uncharacterized delta-60 repeat protein
MANLLITWRSGAKTNLSPCACASKDPVRYLDGTLDYQSSDLTFANGDQAQARSWTNNDQYLPPTGSDNSILNGNGTVDTEIPSLQPLAPEVYWGTPKLSALVNLPIPIGRGHPETVQSVAVSPQLGGAIIENPFACTETFGVEYPVYIIQSVAITLSGDQQMIFYRGLGVNYFVDYSPTNDLPSEDIENQDGSYTQQLIAGTFYDQFNADGLSYDPAAPGGVTFQWKQENGTVDDFNAAGQFLSSTNPNSSKKELATWTDGQLTELAETYGGNGITSQTGDQRVLYHSGPGGALDNAELENANGSGGWTLVRQVEYSYYDGSTGNGNVGDLELASIENAAGGVLSSTYYRYYIAGASGGYQGGLEYVVGPVSFAALTTVGEQAESPYTPFTATDDELAPFADHYYQYNSNHQVAEQIDAGYGSSSDSNGQGTFTYSYSGEGGDPTDPNAIVEQTTETLPDGTQNIVDCDSYGLAVSFQVNGGYSSRTTLSKYDGYGHLIQQTEPPTQANPSGLTEGYTYTSITDTGGGPGKLASTYFQNSSGAVVPQEAYTYVEDTYGPQSSYWLASDTIYRNDDGTGAETTTYQYSFNTSTGVIQSMTTFKPPVIQSQDGPYSNFYTGLSNQSSGVVYDQYGYPQWTRDPNGYINYYASDPVTGTILKQIIDIDAATITSDGLPSLPAGWSILSGTHLDLLTTYTDDGLGRVTSETTPNGNVTYTVYNDSSHTTTVYPGWSQISSGIYSTTGPVQVTHDDWSLLYDETLTYAYTPSSSTIPNGSDTPGTIESLSRNLLNDSGQVIEQDNYVNLGSYSYSTIEGESQFGTAGITYYATTYGYDAGGRQDRVQTPTGTITRTVYDGFDEPISTWVGAVVNGVADDTVDGDWSIYNPGSMTEVSAAAFDADGNEIEGVQYPGGQQPGRATEMYYNWRNQLVAEMNGGVDSSTEPNGGATPDTAANNDTFYGFYTLNNLGEVTGTETYNAEGNAAVQTSDSSSWASSAGMRLTAASFTEYDNQGRIYEVDPVPVDPATDTMNFFAVDSTYTYYDADGNIIASIGPTAGPTGTATKYTYDGAGRLTASYSTDGGTLTNYFNAFFGSSTAYAAAASVSGDIVGSQTEYVYDGDSNIIETITSDRLSGVPVYSSTPGYLQNGNPAQGGAPARVSYSASYYDAADRDIADVNVGTNANTQWTRPARIPARSASALVTSTVYDAAGNVEFVTDPNDLTTAYGYDALGRTVVQVANWTDGTTASGSSSVSTSSLPIPTNSANQTTEYTYDGDNNVTSMTAVMVSPATNEVTSYLYGVTQGNNSTSSNLDDNDLLAQVTYPGGGSESYTYDATGAQTSYTDRNGTVHAYAYDQLGRLMSDTINVFGSNVDQTVKKLTYSYDDAGNMATATSYNAGGGVLNQVVNTYDGFGQLISDAQSHSGTVSSTTPTVGYSRTLFAADDLSAITYPDGRVINYNYDGTGAAGTLLGQIMSVSDSSGILQSYTYLGLDTPVTFTDGNGVKLSYLQAGSNANSAAAITGLDQFGRVASQNWTNSAGTTIDDPQYQYDANGNVLSESNTTSGGQNNIHENQTFTYDGLNRLTGSTSTRSLTTIGTNSSAGTTSTTQSWNLDALGNWNSSSTNGQTTSRVNNSENQIQSLTTPANTTAMLGYDANGNTTKDQNGQQYVYDAWNRLVTVKNSSGAVIASYNYDAQGRQIQITESGATTDLYYSNRWQVLEERQNGAPTKQNVWSPFYVDTLIETDNYPAADLPDSNGSVDTSFGVYGVATPGQYGNWPFWTSPESGTSAQYATGAFAGDVVVASAGTVERLNVVYNGSTADQSFGIGGVVTISDGSAYISGLAALSNGNVLVVYTDDTDASYVAELNADGSLDTSFGDGGVAMVAGTDAMAITVRSDGQILIGGLKFISGAGGSGIAATLTLLQANGSPNLGFGTDGTDGTTTSTCLDSDGFFGFGVGVTDLTIEPNGSILMLVDGAQVGSSQVDAVLLHFWSTGTQDLSFGSSGVAPVGVDLPYIGQANLVSVLANGEILAAGMTDTELDTVVVFKLQANGVLDTSFGSGGLAECPISISGPQVPIGLDVTVQGIVVGTGPYIGQFGEVQVLRFTPGGQLDPNFGGAAGFVGQGGNGYGYTGVFGMAIDADAGDEVVIIGSNYQQQLQLQQFKTVSESWRVYAEQDADGNVISISDSSGNVLERYAYDDYGNVTVLNPDGTVRGNGTAASSLYGTVNLHQGLRLDLVTGLYYDRFRQTYDPTIGRFLQPDPTGPAGSGVDLYQFASGNPISNVDPSGLQTEPSAEQEPGQEGYGGGQGGGSSGEAAPPLGLTGSFNPQTMAEDRLMEQHGDLSPGEASSYERELAADAQYEQQQAALAEQQAQAEAQAEKQAVDSQAQQDEAEDDANLSQAQKDKIAAAKAARACPEAAEKGVNPLAEDAADYAKANNGAARPGYNGGGVFKNKGQVLPSTDAAGNPITYKEYDTNPYQAGTNRGTERVVIGSDGSRYFTDDHYQTFKKF